MLNRKTKKVGFVLSVLIVYICIGYIGLGVETAPQPYPRESFSKETAYPVVRTVDGDTVQIQYNGKPTTVRLIGVDTPETVHPNKPVEAFGKEATAFTRNLLRGESVYLRFDGNRTDKYGRLLAYLYRAPDGLFVNLEIVRQGYGHAYTQYPFTHLELFRHYEQRAREAGKGLWGNASVSAAASHQSAPLVKPGTTDALDADVTVYVTRTGKKYHRAGCRHLSRSQKPLALTAAKRRYSACSVCNR
jgi:micrococcal nuclease